MSRNIKKARITRISKVKADRSLEERVLALEERLAVMQTASRELSTSIQVMQNVNQSVSKSIQKSLQNINIEKEGLDSNHNAVRHKLDIGLKVGL